MYIIYIASTDTFTTIIFIAVFCGIIAVCIFITFVVQSYVSMRPRKKNINFFYNLYYYNQNKGKRYTYFFEKH